MEPEAQRPADQPSREEGETIIHVAHPDAADNEEASEEKRDGEHSKQDTDRRRQDGSRGQQSSFLQRLFGTFVYVYFAVFVMFHVAVALTFLMTSLDPWIGLFVWLAITILGGVCVVALSMWRDSLSSFWD